MPVTEELAPANPTGLPGATPATAEPDPTERSYALLRSWLNPSQLAHWDATKTFFVQGNDTKRWYKITNSHAYNIIAIGSPGEDDRYCVVPINPTPGDWRGLPIGDQLLAQKIWLETDELETLKIANKRQGALFHYG